MKKLLIATLIALSLALGGLVSPALAEDCGDTVEVRRGDSLNKIAKRCGFSLSAVVAANPQIRNISRIFVGQEIQLPRKAQVLSEERPTLVIRPKADRLTLGQIEALGIARDSQEAWIDIDLSSQTVSAYRGHKEVRTFLVSTGTWRYPTVTGRFRILSKHEKDDMRGPGYDLKDVPYTMYFHGDYALHGTYWHDNFGAPMSHGCVNLSTQDARWLFAFAEVGTTVNVHH